MGAPNRGNRRNFLSACAAAGTVISAGGGLFHAAVARAALAGDKFYRFNPPPVPPANADRPDRQGNWGDQGDGTFVNPILPADYSDIDVIRVGEDYYFISSTFQFSPGIIILHSRDLVNWTIVGHVIADLTRITPELNWNRMNRYGRGVWAPAIRYHNKKFRVYVCTPNEGIFMSTAEHITGPWTPIHAVMRAGGWDDPCPFWDDDGQGYLVTTHFSDGYKIYLFKLTADGRGIIPHSGRVIHQSRGSEANKLYKINGWYYHYYSQVQREGRVPMMDRSRHIYGPWETRQLMHVNPRIDREPNQGGFVSTAAGQWWFLTQQGTGQWDGRACCLLPVTWVEDWPIIGRIGSDGIGNMVWRDRMPIRGHTCRIPQTSDSFDRPVLAVQWEWNYQPRADKWSLTDRPGYLRLYAFKPLRSNNLLTAGNTLTQRVFKTNSNVVTVQMDISGMTDGQHAGICHFASHFWTIGAARRGGKSHFAFNHNGKLTYGPAISSTVVWFRSIWDIGGQSRFSFSLDGRRFVAFGDKFRLAWGFYRGDRIGIFNFNNKADSGHVDVKYFHYALAAPRAMST